MGRLPFSFHIALTSFPFPPTLPNWYLPSFFSGHPRNWSFSRPTYRMPNFLVSSKPACFWGCATPTQTPGDGNRPPSPDTNSPTLQPKAA